MSCPSKPHAHADRPAPDGDVPGASQYVTEAEVAAHFRVHKKTVARWAREKRLPAATQIGPRLKRWPRSVLSLTPATFKLSTAAASAGN